MHHRGSWKYRNAIISDRDLLRKKSSSATAIAQPLHSTRRYLLKVEIGAASISVSRTARKN